MAASGTAGTAETVRVTATTNGYLNVNANLGSVDVEIGAVEIKNSTDDTRATVGSAGLEVLATLRGLSGVVLSGARTVGTTATAIPASSLSDRKSLILYNNGTSTIYLGGSAVTSSTGLPVGTADYSPSFDLGSSVLYGVAGTAGGTVIVLEVS
jgi:hypothetical protein